MRLLWKNKWGLILLAGSIYHLGHWFMETPAPQLLWLAVGLIMLVLSLGELASLLLRESLQEQQQLLFSLSKQLNESMTPEEREASLAAWQKFVATIKQAETASRERNGK